MKRNKERHSCAALHHGVAHVMLGQCSNSPYCLRTVLHITIRHYNINLINITNTQTIHQKKIKLITISVTTRTGFHIDDALQYHGDRAFNDIVAEVCEEFVCDILQSIAHFH